MIIYENYYIIVAYINNTLTDIHRFAHLKGDFGVALSTQVLLQCIVSHWQCQAQNGPVPAKCIVVLYRLYTRQIAIAKIPMRLFSSTKEWF